jgi:xanthine dehydrogenase YagR molybdenum-binding subunit
VLAHAVAEAFEIPAASITIEIGRSSLASGPMAAGSRSTATLVPAAQAAAEQLKTKLRGAVRGTSGDNAPWSEVIARAPNMAVRVARPPDSKTAQPDAQSPFTQLGMMGSMFDWVLRTFAHVATGRGTAGAVQIAEVEIDTWLGKTRVTRFYSGLTVGKVRVPNLARSQAEGSIIQGIGYALTEAREYDPRTGHVLSAGLEDYRIPGLADTPAMTIHFDEAGFDHVPGGAIGIGEIATLPVSAAVANAVYNAVGVRAYTAPVQPDRLLALLAAKRSA